MAVIVVVMSVANSLQDSYFTLPVTATVTPPPVEVIDGEDSVPPEIPVVTIDKFDVAVFGLDSREDEPELGARTDSIFLVTIDPDDYYASILSIPRDTRILYKDRWRKINEVFTIDGAEGSVKALEKLLSIHIERYAVIDFDGAIKLIDLMGGVDVDVPVDMYKPLENIDLKKGPNQHLNGYDALGYMRYRDERLSDMDRSERQKGVVLQLIDKLLQPVNILRIPSLASTALTYIETNISLQELLTLVKYGRTILNNGVENKALPGVNDLYKGGWYYVPFLEELGLPKSEAEIEYLEYLASRDEEQKNKAAEAALEDDKNKDTDGASPDDKDAPGGKEDINGNPDARDNDAGGGDKAAGKDMSSADGRASGESLTAGEGKAEGEDSSATGNAEAGAIKDSSPGAL